MRHPQELPVRTSKDAPQFASGRVHPPPPPRPMTHHPRAYKTLKILGWGALLAVDIAAAVAVLWVGRWIWEKLT